MRKPTFPLPTGYSVTQETRTRPEPASYPYEYDMTPAALELLRRIERLDHDVARYQVDPAMEHRLLREALKRNAFGTASIEGNPLSLDDVESLVERGLTPDRFTEPDEREIINYAALIERLPAATLPKTPADVLRLHSTYFDGVLRSPGSFKQKHNFIVSRNPNVVLYVATHPSRTRAEVRQLLEWWHSSPDPALIKAAVFFHEFQSIHPFPDGNGRLGRLLTHLLLWHSGYRGIRYAFIDWSLNEGRDEYYRNLNAVRKGSWDRTPWIEYFLAIVEKAYRIALERFLLVDRLPREINERQRRIAEWFARATREHPRLSFKLNDVHAAFPAQPRRTLTHDLARLCHARILARDGERKAARYRFLHRENRSKPR